jgi:Uma2 family endonuclease
MAVATQTKRWTLRELHSLPDDGNKYELVHGELFVTPAPSVEHETIAARLSAILTPYVTRHGLGHVHHPRSVVQRKGSETEPDLMVRHAHTGPRKSWATAPIPSLVVEIVSPSTRRRDYGAKKDFYKEVGVPEYWIVDGERLVITVIQAGVSHELFDRVFWSPAGVVTPLEIRVDALFVDL